MQTPLGTDMTPDRNQDNHMLYGDWLALNTRLLWCYDHAIHTPLMVTKGWTEETPQGPVRGWLVPSGWAIEGYSSPAAWLVRSGWAQVTYDDNRTLRAEPGQWLIVGQGARVQSFADPTHLLSVSFVAEWPDKVQLLKSGLPLIINATDHPAMERRAKSLVKMVQMRGDRWNTRKETMDYHTFLNLTAAWTQWLHLLLGIVTEYNVSLSTARNIDARVIAALRLLDAHPMDSPLDQEKLAASVHLSLSQLIRLFQRHLHTTPRHYFEEQRVKTAKERLHVPKARAKEVAYGLGFKNLPHFSRWFKKQTGTTPREHIGSL